MSSQIDQAENSEDAVVTAIDIPAAIMVSDLADQLDVGAVEVVKALMRGGYMFSVNDLLHSSSQFVVYCSRLFVTLSNQRSKST